MASRRPFNFSYHLQFLLVISLLVLVATTNAQLKNPPTLSSNSQPGGGKTSKSIPKSSSSSASPSRTPPQSVSKTTLSSHGGGLTNAPTLFGVGVPPLIVPDTSGAPFMQKSDLPEGTVFICVGAALGFLGMSVLAWRGLVAWSLHRSVRRAAKAKYASETKSTYSGAPPTHYSSMYPSANVSLELLASTNTDYNNNNGQSHGRASKQPKRNSARAAANSSLFFSPTAGAGQAGAANRTSSYLPAGFYASGASMPAAGSTTTQLGGPPAAGYGRVESAANTPHATPGHARHYSADNHLNHGPSGSRGISSHDPGKSRNTPQQRSEQRRSNGSREARRSSQQRAPSAALNDLFERHTGMRERN